MHWPARLSTRLACVRCFRRRIRPSTRSLAPWVARLIRPNALAGLRGLWWALTTQPLTTLSVLRTVTLGYAASPSLLVRALATVPPGSEPRTRPERCGRVAAHSCPLRHLPPRSGCLDLFSPRRRDL